MQLAVSFRSVGISIGYVCFSGILRGENPYIFFLLLFLISSGGCNYVPVINRAHEERKLRE